MKKNETNIDDFFKSELGSYTETPPPASWDALEKKLDSKPNPRFSNPGAGFIALLPVMFTNRRVGIVSFVSLILILSIPVIRNMKGTSNSLPEKIAATISVPAPNIKEAPLPDTKIALPAVSSPAGNNVVPQNERIIPKDNDGNKANKSDAALPGKIKNSVVKDQSENINANHKIAGLQNKLPVTNKKPSKTRSSGFDGSNGSQLTENEKPAIEKTKGLPADNAVSAESKELSSEKIQAQESPNSNVNEVTAKKQKTDSAGKAGIKKPQSKPPHKTVVTFNRFEFGVKAGFERGFDNDASKKGVVSPYLQYNISPRFSILTQPAVKYSSFNIGNIGSPRSYYKENNDSLVSQGPSYIALPGTPSEYGTPRSFSQTYDSIVKSYTYAGTYMEYEIPVLLKFKLGKTFSVYGGANIIYSKLTGITENTKSYLKLADSVEFIFGPENPGPQSVAAVLTFKGNPYSNYKGPLYPSPQGSIWRYGYMFGFSWEFTDRWLIDGLVQQGTVKQNMVGGYNTNEPLSAPYFRFTLGYKILQ